MPPRLNRFFDGYIFDLDGTIWLTEALVPGAPEMVIALRARRRRVIFLTNNSDGTREMFAARLTGLGIEAAPDEIINSSFVLARYLQERAPGARCYVIGPDPMREELCRAGLLLRDRPGDIDFVALGIDRDFTYQKLQTAFEAIRAGARFIATNPDPYSPSARGDLADIGALIAAIETASEHKLDVLVGKPNPFMVEIALQAIGLPRGACVMVGDQLVTDVLAGRRAGVPVALLLRDPRVVAQLPGWPEPPDFVLDQLLDLVVEH